MADPLAKKRAKTIGAATRDAYGQALLAVGKADPRVVALDGDLSKSTKSSVFAKAFPERFYNCGIAEANMVGIAAGLASAGKIPFASSFASFLMCKAFDQIRMAVANPRLNVKLVGSHGGISLGEDGASQQSVEDIALACAVPGMSVLVPADEESCRALTHRAAEHTGPVYLRTGRPKAPRIYPEGEPFAIGKAKVLLSGNDLTLAACGLMVWEAMEAAWTLAEKGISTTVLDLYSIKPLDEEALIAAAKRTRAVVTAEEHLLDGGLGSRVARTLSQHAPVPMEAVGLRDTYAESGTPAELFEKYGLTASHIVAAAEAVLKRKG